MTVTELTINDVKRISAVTINPATGEPVILTGDNGNGKSSVLDALELALTNKGLEDPIRHGRASGKVTVTLSDGCIIERKLTRSGDALVVTGPDGVRMPKAQTFLNSLLGSYAFDPLEFTGLKPKEQVEALKIAAGLDFTKLDAERAEAFSKRTDIGRRGKEAKARLDAIAEPLPGTPTEEQSASALMETLRTLEKSAEHLVVAKRQVAEAKAKEEAALQEIDRIKAELKSAENHHSTCAEMIDETQKILATATTNAPTEEQLAAAREAVEQVDKTNAAVREGIAYRALLAETEALREEYSNLTNTIEQVDKDKQEKVKNADLPLDGLELTDDGVMFNGVMFTQLSTAEQIRISTLVAMAQNPELKIVMVREGSLVNRANLGMMAELAASRGFQLWIEKFQEEPGEVGLHIVDGSIAFKNGAAVTE